MVSIRWYFGGQLGGAGRLCWYLRPFRVTVPNGWNPDPKHASMAKHWEDRTDPRRDRNGFHREVPGSSNYTFNYQTRVFGRLPNIAVEAFMVGAYEQCSDGS